MSKAIPLLHNYPSCEPRAAFHYHPSSVFLVLPISYPFSQSLTSRLGVAQANLSCLTLISFCIDTTWPCGLFGLQPLSVLRKLSS
jgi:hypothetical protein